MNKLVSLVFVALLGCADAEGGEDELRAAERDADGQPVESDAGANVAAENDGAVPSTAPDAAGPHADAGADEMPDAGPAAHVARYVSYQELHAITDQKCVSCHRAMPPTDDKPNEITGAWPFLERNGLGDFFPNTELPSRCGDWKYIAAGDPEHSLLYAKLKPNAPCGVHPSMPSPPTAEQIELIGDAMRSWGTDGGV